MLATIKLQEGLIKASSQCHRFPLHYDARTDINFISKSNTTQATQLKKLVPLSEFQLCLSNTNFQSGLICQGVRFNSKADFT